ncbi:MAG: hypothetical protein IPJ89_02255 [Candidatus Iainarchaeum archaeon]|uniref:Uncharacterized protein n=1 Tax=Candidatus Iainarchaeum sp. TaxID=3101447 RepID=A0A7T9DKK6_9ARCH|nr:MAG: hypothetical protein IPJ89_02255 [Candidatus Diapherotrites archaeon]
MPTHPAKQPLMGIQIVETHENGFLLMVGPREKGKMFVSTPAIRKVIETYQLTHAQLGYIDLQVNTAHKSIHTHEYYPLQYGVGHLFFRKGVATLAELQIEKLMLKRFPGYSIVSGTKSLAERHHQIVKRGRVPGEPMPLEQAIALTRAKAIANYRKQKNKEAHSMRGRILRVKRWLKSTLSRNRK